MLMSKHSVPVPALILSAAPSKLDYAPVAVSVSDVFPHSNERGNIKIKLLHVKVPNAPFLDKTVISSKVVS